MSSRVGLILLAAGGSRRLGRAKQLLPIQGSTLIRRAAEAAVGSHCTAVVAVLGAEAQKCATEIRDLPLYIVHNAKWKDGMSRSIQVGLDALLARAPAIEAVILALCDQPRLTAAVIDSLVAGQVASGKSIVASSYEGVLGAPALFSARHFRALGEMRGDQGARQLFTRFPDDFIAIPFQGGEEDIDTPEDWSRVTGEFPNGKG